MVFIRLSDLFTALEFSLLVQMGNLIRGFCEPF